MASSFEKINYNLRPNKSVERKMMCEALARLSFLEHLNKYRYIGFGSPYFTDFILFHKQLGIKELISIEKEEAKKNRFEFNIPYSCIKMIYGESQTILPNLQLDSMKNILWLDYDDRLSEFMFSDIDTFFFNSMPGSFFILSVNIEEEFFDFQSQNERISLKEFRKREYINRVGKDRFPNEFDDILLNTKNLGHVGYEMINRQIKSSLNTRNANNENKIQYKQLFNFIYKDNATILTVGGLIFDDTQVAQINKMDFESLPYISTNKECYRIQSPNLTSREVKALDKILPMVLKFDKIGKETKKKLSGIPLIQTDIEKYTKIYRYFPNYSEINI